MAVIIFPVFFFGYITPVFGHCFFIGDRRGLFWIVFKMQYAHGFTSFSERFGGHTAENLFCPVPHRSVPWLFLVSAGKAGMKSMPSG
jgi:hypothetical protein